MHVPAFSPDGSTIYLQGETVSLIAFDLSSKTIQWVFGDKACNSAPIVDSDGNIYIIPSEPGNISIMLYCLSKYGEKRWEAKINSKNGRTSEEPAIDKWGNIIIGHKDTLFSFSNAGKLNWKKSITPFSITTSVIVDNPGNIYFGAQYQFGNIKEMCFDKSGIFIWDVNIGELVYPPILTADKKLIVPNFSGESIYIIGE